MPAATMNLRSLVTGGWRSLPDDFGLLVAAAGACLLTLVTGTTGPYDWRATLAGTNTVVWLAIVLTTFIARSRRSPRFPWRDCILLYALFFSSVALNFSTARICDPPHAGTPDNRLITLDMAR